MFLIEAKRSEKKSHLERLLDQGTVMVFVDSRQKDVMVPEQHRGNPQLALNFDYAFGIPDFKISEDQVEASLSFNRTRIFCIVPMAAIYALRSELAEEVILFLEDVPGDLTFARATPAQTIPSPEPNKKKHRFKTIDTPAEMKEEKAPTKGKAKEPKEKKKSHLRLVKSE